MTMFMLKNLSVDAESLIFALENSYSSRNDVLSVKGNITEFQVMHHFKALEMLIFLIYWTCDFKVVCSRYSAFNHFIKARVVLF